MQGTLRSIEVDAEVHWSKLAESTSTSAVPEAAGHCSGAHLTNSEIVDSLLSQWPETGDFFCEFGGGSQARLERERRPKYSQVQYLSRNGEFIHNLVLKVFKEGSSLRQLQRQSPHGMLHQTQDDGYWSSFSAKILRGTMAMNGKFAFAMHRY